MAKYQIELDGKKYVLEGGENAPTEDEARAAIGQLESTEKASRNTPLQTAENVINTAGNSALQGFGNKLGAVMDASGEYLLDKLGVPVAQKPGAESTSWKDRYMRQRRLQEQQQQQFEQDRPALALGSDIAGAVVSPVNKLLPMGGSNVAARIGKAAMSGGALGALRGAGMSGVEENPLEEAIKGAGAGAATGGVFQGGLEGIKGIAKGVIAPALGLTSGVGKSTVQRSFEAGKRGSPEFIKNMRGEVSETELVNDTQKAVKSMYDDAARKLSEGKDAIGKAKVNMKPVLDSISGLKKSFEVEGIKSSLINPEEQKVLSKAKKLVKLFNKSPESQNVAGLDKLKQTIGKIPVGNDPSAMRVRTQLYNNVKNAIEESAPEYSAIMKPFADTMEKLNNISGELGVNKGAGTKVYSALGKIQSTTRSDVNSRYGARTGLIKLFGEDTANKILDSAAGQAMSEVLPRSLASKVGATTIGATTLATPAGALGAASLPLFSPRVVGEAAYGLGKVSGKLPKSLKNSILGAILAGDKE